MSVEEDTIKTEIKEYVSGWGGTYSEWNVGIAKDARQRLFEDYGVIEENDAWIYRTAFSSEIARKI